MRLKYYFIVYSKLYFFLRGDVWRKWQEPENRFMYIITYF